MRYYIIVPAHNEAGFLPRTLGSILDQTLAPKGVVVVNDNSTDGTEEAIDTFCADNALFKKLNTSSSADHMPGGKVVTAFNKGLALIDGPYDFLVKLDADLILPPDYFERVAKAFADNPKVGIAGGFIYERNAKGEWKRNHPMADDHVRGAFKAYTKACFTAIGGLRTAMGWDTVDELLARYHGFGTHTDPELRVKHLRPTGNAYDKKARLLQGKAMYTMRYGPVITFIASVKMALKQRRARVGLYNMLGYFEARAEGADFLVSEKEGAYIRAFRWRNIKKAFVPWY